MPRTGQRSGGDTALEVVRQFPDLRLRDHVGNERQLSELAGGDPLLLHFYRGWWCPKEQAFFRRLVRLQDEAGLPTRGSCRSASILRRSYRRVAPASALGGRFSPTWTLPGCVG
ncbi:MAG: redoxin domain-containing protein [Actinomycetota bacterium]|nr:redoxin domain-containing protein [Actinomycetota bacterium]